MSLHDKSAIIQIIGCIAQKPELLLDEQYKSLTLKDFPEKFHQIVYSSVYNLVHQGIKDINGIVIDSYLTNYPEQYAIFSKNQGMEYIDKCKSISNLHNFQYNFDRVKKFSLLSDLQQNGFDVSEIYTDDVMDSKNMEKMSEIFDNFTINDIILHFDKKIMGIKSTFYKNDGQVGAQAGNGLFDLVKSFELVPEMGMPLASGVMNTIFRGARKKKFYLRSAPSGHGKSRTAAADACAIAVRYFYDTEKCEWVDTTISEPTLYITTELEISELQTMVVAYVSGVNEDKILNSDYEGDEEERVITAIKHIENSPFWIEQIPDFSIDDISAIIKRYKLMHEVEFIFFDYIFTSYKMLMDIATKSKGMKLREDNILYIFSNTMKNLANTLDVFIFSATQVSAEWEHVKNANMNIIRGSKAIVDKVDCACILLPVTEEDLQCLQPITQKGFMQKPNYCYHIYKVRRGKFNNIKLWTYIDLGTCRTTDLFVTKNNYELIDVQSTEIKKLLEETEEEINFDEEGDEFAW